MALASSTAGFSKMIRRGLITLTLRFRLDDCFAVGTAELLFCGPLVLDRGEGESLDGMP
jgi:hypothetical protein